ncbi:DUF1127 domain-containing protein [Hypericibacter sp.]|uniref:DUF1127 domain-containing protein n=1 Tax=Hypericibacter sp. TaxID=2705401 RepID=UPI003D6D3CB9
MSNRLRAIRKRAASPPSDGRSEFLPTVLDLVAASLHGRGLPGSLLQQSKSADSPEGSAPAIPSIARDIWQSPARPAWRRIDGLARRLIGSVTTSLCRWRQRARDRQYLDGLNDRMLKDLGLTRAQVESDLLKSFWRD